MKGMHFLLLGENGRPINHGIIVNQVSQERFLCSFAKQPRLSRLCHVDEIGTWNLFPNADEMNAFITAIAAATPPPAKEKTPVKKKAKKKPSPKTVARARDLENRAAKKKKVTKKKSRAKAKR